MRQERRNNQTASHAAGKTSGSASSAAPPARRHALVPLERRRHPAGEVAHRWGVILRRLIRSAIAGGLATVVDLGVLTGLVSLAAWSARSASVPALAAGAVAAFVTQKYYAFQAAGGPVVRQATQFALVQVGSAVLTGVFYDLVLGWAPSFASAYVAVRLVTSNIVWLGFSFPLWHFVFRAERVPERALEARAPDPRDE